MSSSITIIGATGLIGAPIAAEALDRGYDFSRSHVPQDEILDGTHEVKAAIWIDGHAGKADPRCLDAADLYPDFTFETVDDALSNCEFVFGKHE